MPISSRTRVTMEGMFSRFFNPGTGPTGEGFQHAVVSKKIAWINLVVDESRHGALTFRAIIRPPRTRSPLDTCRSGSCPGKAGIWWR
jgi:hypothetical protein